MDWAQILVFTLAILFAIFLAIAITLLALLVSITRQIKAAAASAERAVSSIEDSVASFSKAAIPMMLARGVISQVFKASKKK